MALDRNKLWKKSVTRAATAPANLMTAAASLAASAVLANPLPLILWGLGSTGWVFFASTSDKYLRKIADEEKVAASTQEEAGREATFAQLITVLMKYPFGGWMRAGIIPDYPDQYRRLIETRERINRTTRERRDIGFDRGEAIGRQMNQMLNAYLQFVRARITNMQVLANVRLSDDDEFAGPQSQPEQGRRGARERDREERARVDRGLPSLDERLRELSRKIDQLRTLAEREPATAKTREWHIGILERQKELLVECQKRDQVVKAQLQAIPDMFAVLLDRVTAAQFDAEEVATFVGGLIEQVEETERLVESMRPAMDEMLSKVGVGLSL